MPVMIAAVLLVALAATPVRAAEIPPAASVVQPLAATDMSAAKRKKRSGAQAYGSGRQIACTQLGCGPVPRGCRVVPGRIPFTWDPSGFDEIVCPYRR